MKLTVCAFTIVTLICVATSHAAPIAPLTGIPTPNNITQVYWYHHHRYWYRYSYRPYWWPPHRYHWDPNGPERWGYWWG